MAEYAFSLASNILSTITSPAFNWGFSIWEARDELDKLRVSIETIQAVLLDAEKKQKGSTAIKHWIKRVKGVLYDAEDLFDEVTTDDLIKQQMEGNDEHPLKKKVRVFYSMLNPIVSRDSIANKVKAIRERLDEISKDMAQFGLLRCQHEEPLSGRRVEKDPGSFVDPKYVFGRDKDKKTILEMLFNESNDVKSDDPIVISIVGIGGMGKTTLAQLIYNDEEVTKNFSNRWFACISDTPDEKEVLGKIFQSICGRSYGNYSVSQLQNEIRNSIEGKTFLLVLDDVWDEDHAWWQHPMSLLGCGAKGSKIIVTTRSSSVAEAVGAFKTHNLVGLSQDDSWDLFKSVAFTPERENDRRWTDLGREIVKKCAGVPLAIRSIGSLLRSKTTIQEWESLRDQELSELQGQSDSRSIMCVLQLSYDHLPSNLKHCFAYCSIFPKDFEFDVQKLIYLWIAQGYIKPNEGESIEVAGHSYFMTLLRRSFFQEAEVKDNVLGEIASCKMHDLVHDLAQYVAGEEIVALRTTSSRSYNSARHVRVGCGTNGEGEILQQKCNMRKLRSFMLMNEGSFVSQALDLPYRSCKCLRALNLSNLGIENVPSSIGELKLLRYLGLSRNKFKWLPDSITSLLNLVALDLYQCVELEALPDDFRKLINLMYLNIGDCYELKHMPPRFGELYSLRYLSDFKVGKATSEEVGVEIKRSGLDALAGLVQLRGHLEIKFETGIEDWDGDECGWQLPIYLQALRVKDCTDIRIPHWASLQQPNLVHIDLVDCLKVKYLPHFRYLPYLKLLCITRMEELEYMEEEEEMNEQATGFVNDASLFFPSLEMLKLSGLSKLKGWSRRNDIETTSTTPMQQHRHLSFPILSDIFISDCPELKSMPSSPRICDLRLDNVCGEVVEELLSSTSSNSTTPSSSSSSSSSCLEKMTIRNCRGPINFLGLTLASLTFLKITNCCWPVGFPVVALASLQLLSIDTVADLEILHLASPHLTSVILSDCSGLKSVQVEASALGLCILLESCNQLKNLHLAHPDVIEGLVIGNCPELGFRSVDWDSLSNLRRLEFYPPPEELPECLIHRQSLGKLQISEYLGGAEAFLIIFYWQLEWQKKREKKFAKRININLDKMGEQDSIDQGASSSNGTN